MGSATAYALVLCPTRLGFARIESAGTNAAQLMWQLLSVELPVVRGGGGTNAIARPVIECSSLEEAVEIAAGHPVAQTGTIEVRPLWGN